MKTLYGFQLLSGMILVILSPALKDVLHTLNAGAQGGGILFFSYFIGGTLSTLTISWLARFLPSLRILQISCVLCGAGLFGFSCSHSMGQAVLFYFLVGGMNAILIAFPGALLAKQHGVRSGRAISLLYTFFATGVMLCPFVSGFLLSKAISWQGIFQAMAIICLAYACLVFFSSLPSMKGSEGLNRSSLREARKGDRGLLVGVVLLNALYIGGETSVIGWVVYYLLETFADGTSVFRASRVLTYFWMAMILGRIITALVIERFGSFTTLLTLVTGGILVWICAMATRDLVVAEVLFSLTGLFFSGIFPVIASYAGRFPARHTGLVFSVILAGGGLGGAIYPFLVGWIAETGGIRFGLASALSSLLFMLVLLFVLKHRGAKV